MSFRSVKWFQVLLFNTLLFDIIHLFVPSWIELGLIICFNCTSTFVRHLMPNPVYTKLEHGIITEYSSSSSCYAIVMDIPVPLSPPLPIIHGFRQVFRAISWIYTKLLYVGSSWSSCLCSAVWKGSTGVYHLWARPYFSNSVPHVWFV